jgi:S1-C subfamily serine protease
MKTLHTVGIAVTAVVVVTVAAWRLTGSTPSPESQVSGSGDATFVAATSDTRSDTFPVFRETIYKVKLERMVDYWSVDKTAAVLGNGSGFLLDTPEGAFVVTARHVVEGPIALAEIKVGDTTYKSDTSGFDSITRSSERIRLGDKSLQPNAIWLDQSADDRLDLAVMSVAETAPLGVRLLKPAKASKGDEVELYGFPATERGPDEEAQERNSGARAVANLSRRPQIVTSLERNYFVTEGTEPASSGFSGGPVLNADGEVVGMIIRSSGGQTRCIYIATVLDAAKRFRQEAHDYEE